MELPTHPGPGPGPGAGAHLLPEASGRSPLAGINPGTRLPFDPEKRTAGIRRWDPLEDEILLAHIAEHGTRAWSLLAASNRLPGRNNKACCNRLVHLKRKAAKGALQKNHCTRFPNHHSRAATALRKPLRGAGSYKVSEHATGPVLKPEGNRSMAPADILPLPVKSESGTLRSFQQEAIPALQPVDGMHLEKLLFSTIYPASADDLLRAQLEHMEKQLADDDSWLDYQALSAGLLDREQCAGMASMDMALEGAQGLMAVSSASSLLSAEAEALLNTVPSREAIGDSARDDDMDGSLESVVRPFTQSSTESCFGSLAPCLDLPRMTWLRDRPPSAVTPPFRALNNACCEDSPPLLVNMLEQSIVASRDDGGIETQKWAACNDWGCPEPSFGAPCLPRVGVSRFHEQLPLPSYPSSGLQSFPVPSPAALRRQYPPED